MTDDPTDLTIATYQETAERYRDRTPTAPAPLVDRVLGLLPPGSRVLEIGSGPGRDADALEAGGLVVDRTDAAPAFVAQMSAAGRSARVLDVRHDPLGSPYDGVFANAVLLHLTREALPGVLARLAGAVRPGGILAVAVMHGDGERWSTHKVERPRHFTLWTVEALRPLLLAAGWRDPELTVTGDDPASGWLSVIARR